MLILNDFQTSVSKALSEIDPKWRDYKGLIVCGTHVPHDVEMMLDEIQKARENNIPFLGICFGHHLAVIEWCRNVLSMTDATSEEFSDKGTFVVRRNTDGLHVGLKEVSTPWTMDDRMQSHWNNFSVNKNLIMGWPKTKGMLIQGDYAHIPSKKFFRSVQFHPEYQSSKEKPHPLLVQFLNLCRA